MTREWNGSKVMEEFAKMAAESGLITTDFDKPIIGTTDKEVPVKDHRRYEPTEEYNITKETGEDLVNKAHPEDSKPAEAMGDGGLVENVTQQQKKDIEIATKMPSGALIGRHAELVNSLICLADKLDSEGKKEAALRIDKTLERIIRLPFDLQKDAGIWSRLLGWAGSIFSPVKYIIWGGAAAGALYSMGPAILSKITSLQEDLATDIKDVIDVAKEVRSDNPQFAKLENQLQQILSSFVGKFSKALPTHEDEQALQEYLSALQEFEHVLPTAKNIVVAMTSLKDWKSKIGFGAQSRLEEKIKDVEETFNNTKKTLEAVKNIGEVQLQKQEPTEQKPEEKLPLLSTTKPLQSNITDVQNILYEYGFKVKPTGLLDESTKDALHQLENRLERKLYKNPNTAQILNRRGWKITGSILKDNGQLMDANLLKRLISLSEHEK